MKKMKHFNLMILALLAVVSGAQATEYTSVLDLTSNYFVMSTGCATPYWLGTGGNQPEGMMLSSMIPASDGNYYYRMKAEAVTYNENTYYRIKVVNKDESTVHGGWLNSSGGVFFLGSCAETGTTYTYGQDMAAGGLWDIQYTTDKGFSFKNVGYNKYFGNTLGNRSGETFVKCYAEGSFTAMETTAKTYTELSDLTSKPFMLVNPQGNAVCATGGNDITFADPSTLLSGSNPYLFQLEQVNGTSNYRICIFYPDGRAYRKVGGGWCLNVQNADAGTVVFVGTSWENTDKGFGTDIANGALWTVEASGSGVAFRNVARTGTSYYLNNSTSVLSATAVAYTCATPKTYEESTSAATYTTTAELTSHLFMLTADNSGTEQKLVFQDVWDVKFKAVDDAEYVFGGYYFKAEPVVVDATTYYALHVYGGDGSHSDYYNTWLGHYLNVNSASFTNIFSGSLTNKTNGQDIENGGLWTIVEGTGDNAGKFAFINAAASGDAKYLRIGHWSAGTEPCYFTARNRYSYNTFYRTNTTADKYLSFSFPYDATITGATVYTLSNVDSKETPTKAYLEEVAGGSVSAGKGYILKTTTDGNVTITVSDLTTFTKNTSSNGALVAVLYPKRVPQNTYVLSGNQWLVASDATESNRPKATSTRAYLDLSKATEGEPTAARYLTMNFDSEEEITTLVENLKVQQMETYKTFYNLSGQQVLHPSKGLYIVNGKKVVIK